MPFPDKVVRDKWEIHPGRCACYDTTHSHLGICYKPIIWGNRGKEIEGSWEAHHIHDDGPDRLTNCEILCMECYKLVTKAKSSDVCVAGVHTK